jgi:hypothetical protein
MISAQGISFDVKPSATLTSLLGTVVGLATAAPLFTGLPFPLRGLVAAGTAVFGIWRITRYRTPVLRRVAWVGEGVWSVTARNGIVTSAELLAARRVGVALFLSLRWRHGAGHLVLLPDNTPPQTLRLLRSQLGRGA